MQKLHRRCQPHGSRYAGHAKEFAKLEEMVHGFQQINMAMRYSKVPVVTATQGYVFGGGVEMLMHTDAAVCHAESYIGLVEVGVGLIPGGGGTKEFAVRASESFLKEMYKYQRSLKN